MEKLQLFTLGELAIHAGNVRISASDSRSKKGWLLISYLICHRGQVIPQKDLITLMFCYAKSRSMERSGQATHLALISILGETRRLTERVLKNTVSQLAVQIHENLRRCDVYSQCSVSQFILMLPGANYENSCMVCRRIIAAFLRSHPHTTAKLQFLVHPLVPGTAMP